jgi:hypothetical protein
MLSLPKNVIVPTPMRFSDLHNGPSACVCFSEEDNGPSASAPAPNRLETGRPPSGDDRLLRGADVEDLIQRVDQLQVWATALREKDPSPPSIDQAWHGWQEHTVPYRKRGGPKRKLLVALLLPLLSFPAFAQLSNKRLLCSCTHNAQGHGAQDVVDRVNMCLARSARRILSALAQ